MGEALPLFPAEFNGSIRIEAREERLTSDAGVFALRESLERLKMWSWLDEGLRDERTPELVTHPFIELVRTSILLQAQGYRDLDDADALRMDAALRLAVSSRKGTSPLVVPERPEGKPAPKNPNAPEHLASQPTLSRLTAALATADNRQVLREGLAVLAGRRLAAEQGRLPEELTVDIDSLPIEVEGKQPEASYNGHYRATIYHPLVATVAETGDLIDVNLRRGNCHTAEGAMEFLEPLLERVETHMCHKASVRMDAGFPSEGLLAALEKRGTAYVARVRNNAVLDRMAMPLLKRPAGRRPKEPRTWCHEMSYRAESWSRERRVVLPLCQGSCRTDRNGPEQLVDGRGRQQPREIFEGVQGAGCSKDARRKERHGARQGNGGQPKHAIEVASRGVEGCGAANGGAREAESLDAGREAALGHAV